MTYDFSKIEDQNENDLIEFKRLQWQTGKYEAT
jgi:hypothetical protein